MWRSVADHVPRVNRHLSVTIQPAIGREFFLSIFLVFSSTAINFSILGCLFFLFNSEIHHSPTDWLMMNVTIESLMRVVIINFDKDLLTLALCQ